MQTILEILDVASYFIPILILKIKLGKISGHYGFVILALFMPAFMMMITEVNYTVYWGVIFVLSVIALSLKD